MVVYGKTATCCARATPEEIDAEPERFDCERCELRLRSERLWADNAEAWDIWQVVCNRFVQECELRATALDWATAGWTASQRMVLLRRLDTILDVVQPHDHGRPPT